MTEIERTTVAMLYLHALTGLHPGAGQSLGEIDLPIQRERHTGWPSIPGSTLKGVLRDLCAPNGNRGVQEFKATDDYKRWCAIFGPEANEAHEHAGALSITDARILAFPVRSLRGVFAWITCPAVLARFKQDLELAGQKPEWELPRILDGKAHAGDGLNIVKRLVLEEFDFEIDRPVDSKIVVSLQVATDGAMERLATHLAILDDTSFTHLVKHATEVAQRIKLDYQTKTVQSGALFSIEFLPPETIFYALALGTSSSQKAIKMTSGQIMNLINDALGKRKNLLQIGGDATIGKGLCKVRLDCGASSKLSKENKQ